jgi:hypothetical protein
MNSASPHQVARVVVWLIIVGLSTVGISCSYKKAPDDGRVPARGVVTYNGIPVEGADVSFSPTEEGGRGAAGMTDYNGRFVLGTSTAGDGVFPGTYHVWITKMEVVNTERRTLLPHEAAEIRKSGGKVGNDEMESLLPLKYAKAATSGLSADVTSDSENHFEFELKD